MPESGDMPGAWHFRHGSEHTRIPQQVVMCYNTVDAVTAALAGLHAPSQATQSYGQSPISVIFLN